MIRPSVAADAPAMVRMAKRFHAAMTPDLSFSRTAAAQFFLGAVESPDHCCLTLDLGGPVGALILSASRSPLGPDLMVKEIVFWIEPEHRGRWWRQMIQAAEAWARDKGARAIGLSCFNDGRTVKLFERAGYAAREIVTFKEL